MDSHEDSTTSIPTVNHTSYTPSIISTSSSNRSSGSSMLSVASTAITSLSMGGPEHLVGFDDDSNQDDDPSDYFSASVNDSTTGMSSSYEYHYENGRRYSAYRHRAGTNVLPSDQTEAERQEVHHHIYRLVLGGPLHLSPGNPQRVLDIGTGSGVWALDYAEECPEAEVWGTDVSPVVQSWVPPNCHFVIEDAESEWSFEPNYFNLIHSRNLAQSIRDWPNYLRQIYNHLEPGGYAQILELHVESLSDDGHHGELLKEFFDRLEKALKILGLGNLGPQLDGMIRDAGFVDVEQRIYKLPWAPWPKDSRLRALGKHTLSVTQSGFETYGLALLTRVLGMDATAANSLMEGAFKEVRSKKSHTYNRHFIYVARKPFAHELPDDSAPSTSSGPSMN